MSIAQNPVEALSERAALTGGNEPPAIAAVGTSPRIGRLDQNRVARLVSLVLHPFLVAPLSIVLVLYLDSGKFWPALGWAALCAAFVVGPALFYLRRKLKQKKYTDADVSVREHRHGFYLFGGACMVACFAVLLWLGAPPPLLASFVAALVAVTAFALITRFWTKVSIHSGIMTGVAVMVAFYSIPLALLLALGAFMVGWSRLVLKRHTLNQALLGGVVAVFCVVVVFLPIVSL